MNPSLDALIHPLTRADFFANYEKNEPFVVHHPTEALSSLRKLDFLDSLENLLKQWPYSIQAHLPD